LVVGAALSETRTLDYLDMRRTYIGPGVARAIADALELGTSKLAALDLGDNVLGDTGAVAIAHALRVNKTLTTLRLDRNSIHDVGGAAIADALADSPECRITELRLEGNSLSDAVMFPLLLAQGRTHRMETLRLDPQHALGAPATMAMRSHALRLATERRSTAVRQFLAFMGAYVPGRTLRPTRGSPAAQRLVFADGDHAVSWRVLAHLIRAASEMTPDVDEA